MAPPGRRRSAMSPLTLILSLVFLFSSTASAASAVLGIDLGTEYIKAALVKPGIPLEIVLTKDSKRKEISAVAFKPTNGGKGGALPAGEFPERFYGSDAVALQARFPGDVYPNLKHLLGIESSDATVKIYNERYPALGVAGLDQRKTVALKSGVFADSEPPFSVEELLAMELKNVRENAKIMAGKGTDVSEAVITVPPFYTVEERRALEVAARLAGLKVMSLVTDGLAVGVHYATSRTFPNVNDGGKPETHLVFDMGAGSASATILRFQGKTVKDVGRYNKTIQEVQVLGAGWDRKLGGDSLNTLLVDDMVASFVELPGAKSASVTADKVKTHGRTAAKIWKEAEKVRQVLSANTETSAYFEGLYEDVDFRYKVSRTKFEELAAAFADRVDKPINDALEAAKLKIADIDSVIVHGGASRTPFVQARLEKLAGKGKLKTNVNADEAAVFGAAFKAAGLSPSFRVKEIRDIDTQGYAHGIQYSFNLKNLDQKIFQSTSKVGAIKELPFQMMGEFEFTMYQAVPGDGAEIAKKPVLHFKSGNLTRQVTKMIDTDGCDRESFHNYVEVQLSPITGTPDITRAWVTCKSESKEEKGGVFEGVKNLFGGGKKDQEPLKEGESSSDTAESATSSEASSSTSAEAEAQTGTGKPVMKDKKQLKSAITYTVTQLGYEKHPRTEFKRMQDRLLDFDKSDKARRVREEVLNSLEAFTYRGRDLLEDDSFIAVSTDKQRSTIETALSEASEWIYGEGRDATKEVLDAKLKSLKDLVDPVLKRKDEARDRPAAIKSVEDAIEQVGSIKKMVSEQITKAAEASSSAAEEASKTSASPSASSTTADDLEDEELLKSSSSEPAPEPTPAFETMYSEEDLKSLTEAEEAGKKWLEEKVAAQKKVKDSEDPAFTVKELQEKAKSLNEQVMELMMKKMRVPPTKPKSKKPKATKKASKDKKAKADGKDAKSGPTEDEIKEALRKAGVNEDKIKLANMGSKDELKNKDGKPYVKLDLGEDASEEEIMEALNKATQHVQDHAGDAEGEESPDHNEL